MEAGPKSDFSAFPDAFPEVVAGAFLRAACLALAGFFAMLVGCLPALVRELGKGTPAAERATQGHQLRMNTRREINPVQCL